GHPGDLDVAGQPLAAMEPGTYGRDDRSHETHAVTRNVAAPCERLPERRRGEVCRRSFQGAKCDRPGCERSPAIGAPPDRSQRSDDGGTIPRQVGSGSDELEASRATPCRLTQVDE